MEVKPDKTQMRSKQQGLTNKETTKWVEKCVRLGEVSMGTNIQEHFLVFPQTMANKKETCFKYVSNETEKHNCLFINLIVGSRIHDAVKYDNYSSLF